MATTTALVGGVMVGWRLWGTIDDDQGSFTEALFSPPNSFGSVIGGNAGGEVRDMIFLKHV